MSLTLQSNPAPLGNIVVATPGTPVRITVNLPTFTPPVTAAVTDEVPANAMYLASSPISQTGAGNIGSCYVGSKTMVRATLVGVIGIIPSGQSFQITCNVALNVFDLSQLYLDADNANDACFGSFVTI